MRMHSMLAPATILSLLLLLTQPAAGEACRVMILRASDHGVVLEPVRLVEGEAHIFAPGEIITVVLPFGIGMSGDLVQAADRTGSIHVVCSDGVIRVSIRGENGETKALPDVSLADATAVDLRVNVTSGDGAKKAFAVRGYSTVEDADGPVVDMFGGAIPMSAGDYSITTEVTPGAAPAVVTGTIPLEVRDGFLLAEGSTPGGGSGLFVVDFGAGTTLVTKDFLPAGTVVEPVLAVEHSAEGERVLPSEMTGAGGDVAGFLGASLLDALVLGDIVLRDYSVRVIGEMPDFGSEPIAGILGLDVLERAGVASVAFGPEGAGVLTLTQAGLSGEVPDGAIELPFNTAAGHIFLDGALGDTPVMFLFDTGARSTIIPTGLADVAGLEAGTLPPREFRGLDGNLLPARSVVADFFTLAGRPFPPLEMYAADLPVLEGLGLDEGSGLLGIDFVLGFSRFDVDFSAGVLRLWRKDS